MSRYGLVENEIIVQVIKASATFNFPPGQWVELPYGVSEGWNYDGQNFTDPNGNPPPTPAPPPPQYRTLLYGTEWVEEFTDAEWAWLKTKRATSDRLDQMMDAIRWTNSIDVASPNMDEFYTWLLNNGIPGGQTRIDELRQGILE